MTFEARYDSTCPCGKPIREGDAVGWVDGEVVCGDCVEEHGGDA